MSSQPGPTQILVLLALEQVPDDEAPPTSAEIADYVAQQMGIHARRRTSEAEAVNAALRRLERRGLVQRLGTAANGARCWRITDAGRHALLENAHAR